MHTVVSRPLRCSRAEVAAAGFLSAMGTSRYHGRLPWRMIVVVMGVSGSGKTTIGRALAERLGADFLEGDTFHSSHSIAKMNSGVALTDDDRGPWLEALRNEMLARAGDGRDLVVACSALKRSYRRALSYGIVPAVRWVFLDIGQQEARQRLEDREGHFMPSILVASQFDALETPRHALSIDATRPVDDIVTTILAALPR